MSRRLAPRTTMMAAASALIAGAVGCGGAQMESAPAESEESAATEVASTAPPPPADDMDSTTEEREEETGADQQRSEEGSLVIVAQASAPPPRESDAERDRRTKLSRAIHRPPAPRAASPAAPARPTKSVARAGEGGGAGAGVTATRSAPPAATPQAMSPAAGAPAARADGRRVVPLPRPATGEQQALRALTAATVPDVDRRVEHLEYLARHQAEAAQLGLDLSRRVRFRVIDDAGRPVHDAALTLVGPGTRAVGRTHADGYWDAFLAIVAPQAAGPTTLFVQAGGTNAQATVPLPAQGEGRDIVIRLPNVSATAPEALDVAFLVDVTGSMGDELRYVNEEVVGIVERVRASVPNTRVRVAATFYRDRGDSVPIAQLPFTTDARAFAEHMRLVEAGGGGDYPEDVNLGLAAALTTLEWSEGRAVRVLVLIADAPPQPYADFPFTYRDAMVEAGARGIRILPVAASGADRVVEYLFRAMGAFTSTPYVYLTDDSGIGGSHLEADTDRVAVEMFSDLLTRLLVSDLQGLGMHEPPAPEGLAPLAQAPPAR